MLHATTGLCNPTPTLPPTMHRRGRGFSGEVGGGSAAAELNMLTLSEKFMAGARHCAAACLLKMCSKRRCWGCWILPFGCLWLHERVHTPWFWSEFYYFYTQKSEDAPFCQYFSLMLKIRMLRNLVGKYFHGPCIFSSHFLAAVLLLARRKFDCIKH